MKALDYHTNPRVSASAAGCSRLPVRGVSHRTQRARPLLNLLVQSLAGSFLEKSRTLFENSGRPCKVSQQLPQLIIILADIRQHIIFCKGLEVSISVWPNKLQNSIIQWPFYNGYQTHIKSQLVNLMQKLIQYWVDFPWD